MATTISGKLINGIGEPIKNCKITLKSISTSTTVIAHTTASQAPSAAGDYSMSVEPGKYKVTLGVDGFPPEYVGDIQVYKDSLDGTLNYFLGLPQDDDLRPDAIKHFEAMVDKVASQVAEVEKSKLAAEGSARSAAASADRASQITGLSTVADAISMASVPLPDVWIPFNDSLQMLTGYGEEVKVGAVTVAKMASFSRATTATYTDKSGTRRIAKVDEPRFEKNGLFIEGQGTNLNVKSIDFSSWRTYSGNTLLNTGKTDELGNEIWEWSYIAPEVISNSVVMQNPYGNLTPGRTYTASCFIKGSKDAYVEMYSADSFTRGEYIVEELADGWRRESLTFTTLAQATGYYLRLQVRNPTVPKKILLAGFQLEMSPFATSYILTNGSAVTRARDECSIDTRNNYISAFSGRTMSVYFDSKIGVKGDLWALILSANPARPNKDQVTYSSKLNQIWFDFMTGVVDEYKSVTAPNNGAGFVTVRNGHDGAVVSINGEVTDSQFNASSDALMPSKIYIGGHPSSPGSSLFGHVRNLRIWHSPLTKEQIKVIR
ncbi:prophage tail fiber N-terminal domain-containing protein [Edwardsiella tarda]|uniref:Lambda-like tail fibre protein N-terminal domain-containing protein n=1 Tax=Edwardsiella tarda TaxID=636 RepID=A0A2A7U150_EDWTA|nr:prophage tail fiber N-terminal domain-containing protein [Edwardsiella tarda]PEH72095.1 hypothetical protein CRM76_09280 [Edwardsiella tarda]